MTHKIKCYEISLKVVTYRYNCWYNMSEVPFVMKTNLIDESLSNLDAILVVFYLPVLLM